MRVSTFPLHDKILGGQLRQILADLAAEGLSQEDITYRLRSEHNVEVSKATVRRWLAECDIRTVGQPSSEDAA